MTDESEAKAPLLGHIRHLHMQENSDTDSLEFGPASMRAKVYFSASDKATAELKIKIAIDMMDFARTQLASRGLDAAKKAA